MKFKTLFAIFNIVLILSFLTVFLLPAFILDRAFMVEFWSKNWYFALVFILVIFLVNVIFLTHWKMLSCLEKEDWPGLSQYLENRIFGQKKYNRRNVGLLCDSLLLLGDFSTLQKLEKALRTDRPRLLAVHAVKFASAFLLSGDYQKVDQFSVSLCREKGSDTDWLTFYAAFSRHLAKKTDDAVADLIYLSESASAPLVTALGGYMTAVVLPRSLSPERGDECIRASEQAKKRITAKYSKVKWNALVEDSKAEMQVVVLGKLVDEASLWLFA
jgi:hypothetical protein